jgi:hypothetical protein
MCVHRGECPYVYEDMCLYRVSKKILQYILTNNSNSQSSMNQQSAQKSRLRFACGKPTMAILLTSASY